MAKLLRGLRAEASSECGPGVRREAEALAEGGRVRPPKIRLPLTAHIRRVLSPAPFAHAHWHRTDTVLTLQFVYTHKHSANHREHKKWFCSCLAKRTC
jgi:hypothetical protein